MQNKIQLIITRTNNLDYIVPKNFTLPYNKAPGDIRVSNDKSDYEIILVNVKGMSEQERQQIRDFMTQCLDEMKEVAIPKIEWPENTQNLQSGEKTQWENKVKQEILNFLLQKCLTKQDKHSLIKQKQNALKLREQNMNTRKEDLDTKKQGLKQTEHNLNTRKEDLDTQELFLNKKEQDIIKKTQDLHKKFMSAIGIVILLGLVAAFFSTCYFFPTCKTLFTKQSAPVETMPNNSPANDLTDNSHYTGVVQSLCKDYDWCKSDTEQALRSKFDQEKILDISDKLHQPWSFLLSTLEHSSTAYLEDHINFAKDNFEQIIAQQHKLRQVFSAFKAVESQIFSPVDSEAFPVLSFVYQMKKTYTPISDETTTLPFFTKNDVEKAKVLGNMIKKARSNHLIENRLKVFDSLCQLNTIDVLYNSENQIKKFCITPNKEFQNERQCERITEVQQNQAQFFVTLRNTLSKDLDCPQ